MRLAVLRFALLFAGVAALPLPSFSQANLSHTEADSFRLSMPKVRATMSAYRNLLETIGNDAALAARFKAAKTSSKDTNGKDTISLAAARLIASEPKVALAFSSAGTTPKETSMTMECLVGVMFGSAMLENSKASTASLPTMVRDNLAFFEANKAEVMAAFKQLEGVGGRAGELLEEQEENN